MEIIKNIIVEIDELHTVDEVISTSISTILSTIGSAHNANCSGVWSELFVWFALTLVDDSKYLTSSTDDSWTAKCRALLPCFDSATFVEAPALISRFTFIIWPLRMDKCNAVMPSSFAMSRSSFCFEDWLSIRAATHRAWFSVTATCNGVFPLISATLGLAPESCYEHKFVCCGGGGGNIACVPIINKVLMWSGLSQVQAICRTVSSCSFRSSSKSLRSCCLISCNILPTVTSWSSLISIWRIL